MPSPFRRRRRCVQPPCFTSAIGPRSTRRCRASRARGEPLWVLWEHEIDARILEGGGWSTVTDKGFDEPALFAAYLRTLSWNCVTATDPNLFQVPFRSGIRVDAYQFDPLRKALRLPRFRTIFQSVATNLSRHGRCTRRRVELPWGKYVLYNGHNLFYVNNL